MKNLKDVCKGKKDLAEKLDKLRITEEYDLGTEDRNLYFWAQCLHETGGLQWLTELGNLVYFRKYEVGTDIGKRLGNTHTGDGSRFKGRGLIQLTGRYNYEQMAIKLRLPEILEYPDMVATDPVLMLEIAQKYWRDRGCQDLADKKDFEAITRKINGGLNGLEDRKKWLKILS